MGKLILVSGENNSGKSLFAEDIVAKCEGERLYVATMIAKTDENYKKIEKHKNQRAGLGFVTIEEPFFPARISADCRSVVLLEDVSNLLANNMFEKGRNAGEVFGDIMTLAGKCKVLIAVTISGLDPCGYDGETGHYIESLNRINRMLCDEASVVISMMNGKPVYEKGDICDIF